MSRQKRGTFGEAPEVMNYMSFFSKLLFFRSSIDRELKWLAAKSRNVQFQSLTNQALSAMDKNIFFLLDVVMYVLVLPFLPSLVGYLCARPLISSDDETVAKDRRRNRKVLFLFLKL